MLKWDSSINTRFSLGTAFPLPVALLRPSTRAEALILCPTSWLSGAFGFKSCETWRYTDVGAVLI